MGAVGQGRTQVVALDDDPRPAVGPAPLSRMRGIGPSVVSATESANAAR